MPWKKQDREIPEGKGYYETDETEERERSQYTAVKSQVENNSHCPRMVSDGRIKGSMKDAEWGMVMCATVVGV